MRWFRWIHLSVVLTVVGVVGLFSLSDGIVGPGGAQNHGPSILRFMARQLATGHGIGGGLRQSIPFDGDTIMHFIAWSGVGVASAGLLSRIGDRINLLLGLVALSAFFEAGQRYLTSSRSAEFTDLVANGTGLLIGFTLFTIAERTVGALFSDIGARTERLIRHRLRFS